MRVVAAAAVVVTACAHPHHLLSEREVCARHDMVGRPGDVVFNDSNPRDSHTLECRRPVTVAEKCEVQSLRASVQLEQAAQLPTEDQVEGACAVAYMRCSAWAADASAVQAPLPLWCLREHPWTWASSPKRDSLQSTVPQPNP